MGIYDNAWLHMVIFGYVWLCTVMYGYAWLYMASKYGYESMTYDYACMVMYVSSMYVFLCTVCMATYVWLCVYGYVCVRIYISVLTVIVNPKKLPHSLFDFIFLQLRFFRVYDRMFLMITCSKRKAI